MQIFAKLCLFWGVLLSSVAYSQINQVEDGNRVYALRLLREAKELSTEHEPNVQADRCLAIGFAEAKDFDTALAIARSMNNPGRPEQLTELRIRQPFLWPRLPPTKTTTSYWNRKSTENPRSVAFAHIATMHLMENGDIDRALQLLTEADNNIQEVSRKEVIEILLQTGRGEKAYDLARGFNDPIYCISPRLLKWIAKTKPDQFDVWIERNEISVLDEVKALNEAGRSEKAKLAFESHFSNPANLAFYSRDRIVSGIVVELARSLELKVIARQLQLDELMFRLKTAESKDGIVPWIVRAELAESLYESEPNKALQQLERAIAEMIAERKQVVADQKGEVSSWEVAYVVCSAIICEKGELLQEICDAAVKFEFGTGEAAKDIREPLQLGLERLLRNGHDDAFWKLYQSRPTFQVGALSFGTFYENLPNSFRFEDFHRDIQLLILAPATLVGSENTRQRARELLLPLAVGYTGSVLEDQSTMDGLDQDSWSRGCSLLRVHAGFWGEHFGSQKEMSELANAADSFEDSEKVAVKSAYVANLIEAGRFDEAKSRAQELVESLDSPREKARCYMQLALLFIDKHALISTSRVYLQQAAAMNEQAVNIDASLFVQVDDMESAFAQLDRATEGDPKGELELVISMWSALKMKRLDSSDPNGFVIKPVEEWECDEFAKRLADGSRVSVRSVNAIAACYIQCNAQDKALAVLDSLPKHQDRDTLESRIGNLIRVLAGRGHAKPAVKLFEADQLLGKPLDIATQLVWISDRNQIRRILKVTEDLPSKQRMVLLLSAADRLLQSE